MKGTHVAVFFFFLKKQTLLSQPETFEYNACTQCQWSNSRFSVLGTTFLFFFETRKQVLPLNIISRHIAGDKFFYKVWCMIKKYVRIVNN